MRIHRSIALRVLAVAVAGGLSFGGCGGNSDDESKPASDAPDNGSDDNGGGNDDSGDDAVIPDIADATWSHGRIHVEVTGDTSDSFESDGSGATLDGQTSAAWADNDGRLVTIGLGGGLDAAIALSIGDMATSATFGKDCDITFTQNDASGLAAEFSCDDVEAVTSSSSTIQKISVTGNFTLTP